MSFRIFIYIKRDFYRPPPPPPHPKYLKQSEVRIFIYLTLEKILSIRIKIELILWVCLWFVMSAERGEQLSDQAAGLKWYQTSGLGSLSMSPSLESLWWTLRGRGDIKTLKQEDCPLATSALINTGGGVSGEGEGGEIIMILMDICGGGESIEVCAN